jgi:hypothetical protein
LRYALAVLERERRELVAFLGAGVKATAPQMPWPVWQSIMAVIFLSAGFGFTLMSFEPFGLDPEILWLCSIGTACLCAYATAQFLDKTDLKIVVLGLSITLFVLSIAGLATLAAVRGTCSRFTCRIFRTRENLGRRQMTMRWGSTPLRCQR